MRLATLALAGMLAGTGCVRELPESTVQVTPGYSLGVNPAAYGFVPSAEPFEGIDRWELSSSVEGVLLSDLQLTQTTNYLSVSEIAALTYVKTVKGIEAPFQALGAPAPQTTPRVFEPTVLDGRAGFSVSLEARLPNQTRMHDFTVVKDGDTVYTVMVRYVSQAAVAESVPEDIRGVLLDSVAASGKTKELYRDVLNHMSF